MQLWHLGLMRDAEGQLETIVAGITAVRSVEAIDEALRARREVFRHVRPTVLAAALSAVEANRVGLRRQLVDQLAEERRRRAAARMVGVRFPGHAIPPQRHALVRSIAEGMAPGPSPSERSFLAGIVAEASDKCGLPRGPEDLLKLWRIVTEALPRAAFGAAYTGNFAAALGSAFGNQASFGEGSLTIRTIGCEDPFVGAFLASLLDFVEGERQDPDGGVPLHPRNPRAGL